MKLNTAEVAQLQPDYLGFIFWERSSRYFEGEIPALPDHIKKVGVFVDSDIDSILENIKRYGLQGVQLHGQESPEFCTELLSAVKGIDRGVEIIKVFSIKKDFDFEQLSPFETTCDYYLFDTKGKLPGGNGFTFDWSVLEKYPSTKPYFLSGGIGTDEVKSLKEFQKRPESAYCHAIDLNSKFELEPGLKDVPILGTFMRELGVRS